MNLKRIAERIASGNEGNTKLLKDSVQWISDLQRERTRTLDAAGDKILGITNALRRAEDNLVELIGTSEEEIRALSTLLRLYRVDTRIFDQKTTERIESSTGLNIFPPIWRTSESRWEINQAAR